MSNLIVLQDDELDMRISNIIEKALAKLLPQRSNAEEYMTRKEVADYFKVSLPTLHQYINKGLLTAYKVAGRTLFKRCEVEDVAKKKFVYRYKHNC
ncbi:MAG: helix-turn-helix domain-containing protein [Rikenellaceae bacterium]